MLTNDESHLSTIKDGSTNEILAYNVSSRMTLDFATDTLVKLTKNKRVKLPKGPLFTLITEYTILVHFSKTRKKTRTWAIHVEKRELLG